MTLCSLGIHCLCGYRWGLRIPRGAVLGPPPSPTNTKFHKEQTCNFWPHFSLWNWSKLCSSLLWRAFRSASLDCRMVQSNEKHHKKFWRVRVQQVWLSVGPGGQICRWKFADKQTLSVYVCFTEKLSIIFYPLVKLDSTKTCLIFLPITLYCFVYSEGSWKIYFTKCHHGSSEEFEKSWKNIFKLIMVFYGSSGKSEPISMAKAVHDQVEDQITCDVRLFVIFSTHSENGFS